MAWFWNPNSKYEGPNKTPKRPSPSAYEVLKEAIKADKDRRKDNLPNPCCTRKKPGGE